MSTLAAPETLPGVDRRTDLSLADFTRTYLLPRQPVVVSDALKTWPALGRWTPEFFRDRFPERQVTVRERPRALGPFIDEVLASSPEKPAPYLHNEDLRAVFPELVDDIMPLPPYLAPNWLNRAFSCSEAKFLQRVGEPELYIGGAGQTFPVMHWDYAHTHAFLMQIYGQKKYFVYAPDQTPYVYQDEHEKNRSQIRDVENPDLTKFPLFAQARGASFLLSPGEMLFIPAGWWHTVRMLTTSITVSVNVANRSNWDEVRADYSSLPHRTPAQSRELNSYMRRIGWQNRLKEFFS